jgi:hypothetical protein
MNETRKKAKHVLTTRGRAPVVLDGMNDAEIESLAALVGGDGLLIEGAIQKYQEIMVAHHERLKAVVDEDEAPAEAPETN